MLDIDFTKHQYYKISILTAYKSNAELKENWETFESKTPCVFQPIFDKIEKTMGSIHLDTTKPLSLPQHHTSDAQTAVASEQCREYVRGLIDLIVVLT